MKPGILNGPCGNIARKCTAISVSTVFVYLVLFSPQKLAGQDLSFEGEVVLSDAGHPMVEFDLGNRSMREPTTVRLVINNRLERTFSFTKVVVSCSCTDAKLLKNTLSPMGSTELILTLRPIETVSKAILRNHIFLEEEKGKGVDVNFKVSVEGLLSFQTLTAVIEVGAEDRDKNFLIPFQFTSPVSLENIKARGSGGLTGLKIATSSDDSGANLICKLDDNVFENGGIGDLVIEDRSQNKQARLSCIITRAPPMRLMPSVLRFVENKDEQLYTATSLLRIDRSFLHWSGETETSEESYVEFALKSAPIGLKLDYNRVSKGLYRLRFSGSRKVFDGVREVEIEADTTSHTLSLKCRVMPL
jgi:hypothetical protein